MNFRTAPVLAFALLAAASQADVKVVSNFTMTGGANVQNMKMVTYYRGDSIRVETEKAVALFDTVAGKIIMIDDKAKTYSEVVLGEGTPGLPEIMKQMKVTAKTDIQETAEKKVIAGKNATKWIADLDMTMTLPPVPEMTQKAVLHLEQWTTQEIPGVSRELMVGVMGQMLGNLGASPDVKDMLAQMSKIKGLPLSSNATMTTSMTITRNGQPPETHSMNLTFTTDVQTVTEGKFADTLYAVPADYKKVVRNRMQPGAPGGSAS